ncbi:MAG: IMS domain-containing protein [Cyanobacteriota bacterium]|nr:IMS domain-containing protein [Cyanobacteriota bacterium]
MRIPLDYYRILGLPIQATAEQMRQAHKDRTQQLPRREYSEVAIAERKQLIDEAYAILSDPQERQAYDVNFLAKTYGEDTEQLETKPGINIEKQEAPPLFEKTQIQSIPQEPLESVGSIKSPPAEAMASGKTSSVSLGGVVEPNTPSIEISDRQFVGALSILQELGEYELVLKLTRPYLSNNNMGLVDGRFGDPALVIPDITLTVASAYLELGREQWQQGQYENAAQSLESGQELLLRENLFPQIRGEIQADLYKLRPYRIIELLALPEEKALSRHRGLQLLQDMLNERGGIDGQGDDRSGLGIEDFLKFIQQLRRHLTTTEQKSLFEAEARRPSAVATYLAVYTLLAQGFDQQQPALIRKAKLMLMQLGRSQDVHLEKAVCSLLLGQTEEASRALELSQEYEPLSFIRENSQDSPDLLPGLCLYADHWLSEEVFPHFRDLADKSASLKEYFADEHVQAYLEALPTEAEAANQWVVVQPHYQSELKSDEEPAASGADGISTSETDAVPFPSTVGPGVPPPNFGSGAMEEKTALGAAPTAGMAASSAPSSIPPSGRRVSGRTSSRFGLDESSGVRSVPRSQRRASNKKDLAKVRLLLILAAILGLSFLLLWWLLGWLVGAIGGFNSSNLEGEQPTMQPEPVLEIPSVPEPVTLSQSGPITEEVAELAIETWLETKAAALGPNHSVERMRQILVEPALSRWLPTATALRRDNSYRQYEHSLTVEEVIRNESNPDRAQVEAVVREKAEFYDNGRLSDSRDDNLRVRYDLIRQNGQWHIRDWDIL